MQILKMCCSYSRATVSAILGNCDIGIDFFEKTQGQHFFFFFSKTPAPVKSKCKRHRKVVNLFSHAAGKLEAYKCLSLVR